MDTQVKYWTLDDIRTAMTQNGSHWWDRDSMRFFQTRVGDKVYQGSGGVFFVSSERCSDEPRKYSVRQFIPETLGIETIGGFNTMTRCAAHRLAVESAGPDCVEREKALRPVSAAEQLAIDIKRGGGACTIAKARRVISLAKRYHRLCEDECNYGGRLYGEDAEPTPYHARLRRNITLCLKGTGCKAILGGDPRGCVVKLQLPNGDTNDFGKEGWCVPTN